MADKLSIPSNIPITDTRTGSLSQPWLIWFNNLYKRVGESNGLSNAELEQQAKDNSESISDLNIKVENNNTDIKNIKDNYNALDLEIANVKAVNDIQNQDINDLEEQQEINTQSINDIDSEITILQNSDADINNQLILLNQNIITDINNIGTGLGIYKDTTDNKANLISLKAGSNITLDNITDPNTIIINSTGGGGGGGSSTLADLTDVDLSNPQNGQILIFNNGKWVNSNNSSSYEGDATKLISYLNPVPNQPFPETVGGQWSGNYGLGYMPDPDTSSKYGAWGYEQAMPINTQSQTASQTSLIRKSGQMFPRNGVTRAVIKHRVGPDIKSSAELPMDLSSTFFLAGIDTESNNGNIFGYDSPIQNIMDLIPYFCIGVGWGLSETTLSAFFCDTNLNRVRIPLGENFPVINETAGLIPFYDIYIDNMGSMNNVKIIVKRLDVPFVFETIVQPFIPFPSLTSQPVICLKKRGGTGAKSIGVSHVRCYLWNNLLD